MSTSRRALLSVSDKRGLADFARGLAELGFEIVSTGGTAAALAEAGVGATPITAVTGFPEVLGGRVKTLHPRIHGALLADPRRPAHRAEIERYGIVPIALVAVNLYPFRQTAARPEARPTQVLEAIDIGGPAMVRAAAKNHAAVAVVVDPDDYPEVLACLREAGAGELPGPLRRRLAAKAFRHTADYDAAIAEWFARAGAGGLADAGVPEPLPAHLTLALERVLAPRYGENPHQRSAAYRLAGGGGLLGGFRQLQGKDLSYNNLLDADAARRLVSLLAAPACAIVKHNNPCGVGLGDDAAEAYHRALATDPEAAFGGIVALNRPADAAFAAAVRSRFMEVLLAPEFDEEARTVLAAKTALRLLVCPAPAAGGELELRSIAGGVLVQTQDAAPDEPGAWTCVTRRAPSAAERQALALAWTVARAVKSNAIVIANERQTVGIGAGQMSRVDACRLAAGKAVLPITGCAAASDAFLPFADGLEALAAAGVGAVVQPGGSKRDAEVIAAADARGVAMLFTGRRHFRH